MSCKVLIPINDQEAALYSLESVMARKWPDGAQFMLMTVVEDLAATVPASRAVHKEVLAAEQAEYMEYMKGWIERLRESLSIVFPDTSTEVNSGEICEKILETAAHWALIILFSAPMSLHLPVAWPLAVLLLAFLQTLLVRWKLCVSGSCRLFCLRVCRLLPKRFENWPVSRPGECW